MNDINENLRIAARNNDQDAFVAILLNTPFTIETYNIACENLPYHDAIGQWLLEGFGEKLWAQAQDQQKWEQFGGLKKTQSHVCLDVDALLAGSDCDGRWFDYFRYRWDNVDGSFVEPIEKEGEIRLKFFETAWYYAVCNNNLTVLKQMFDNTQWRKALENLSLRLPDCFQPDFEISSPEVVNLLVQSEVIPFETILYKQLDAARRGDILQCLFNDPRATPEFVVQVYIKHWHTPYYHTDFSNTLYAFVKNYVTQQDIAVLHNKIVEQCFIKDRRDLPKHNSKMFVECLKNTPLLDDATFVCAMLDRVDKLHPRSGATDVLEIFVDSLSSSEWDFVVAHHSNTNFLKGLPRWQKHILLQQIDLQNNDLQDNPSERRKM